MEIVFNKEPQSSPKKWVPPPHYGYRCAGVGSPDSITPPRKPPPVVYPKEKADKTRLVALPIDYQPFREYCAPQTKAYMKENVWNADCFNYSTFEPDGITPIKKAPRQGYPNPKP